MSAIPARDFCIAVSMSDFVTWFGDGDHDFVENAALKAALNALGVTVDLRALHVAYFERTPVGTGDVYVYQPSKNSKNVFALNLYRDLTDQMDIVSFGIGCDEHWADSSLKCNTCHRVRSADAKHPIQALSTASA